MIILAYNLSNKIDTNLRRASRFRKRILTTPLTPRDELRIRWDATLDKLYWSLALTNTPLTRKEMEKLLSKLSHPRLPVEKKMVLNYKEALDYINNEWLVTAKPIDLEVIKSLHKLALNTSGGINNKSDLEMMTDYLEKSDEDPIIQAGIAQSQIINIAPFKEGNGLVARLLPYVYLYKYGFDIRGLFSVDEYFRRDVVGLKAAIDSVGTTGNLTLWLEYYTAAVASSISRAYKKVNESNSKTELPTKYFTLTKRQKKIVNFLDSPFSRITNSDVQEKFKVSQITAARDLTKLAKLNILLKHGGGRSTYYTKA